MGKDINVKIYTLGFKKKSITHFSSRQFWVIGKYV